METDNHGPTGEFATFRNLEPTRLCAQYNTIGLYGRTNWRLATRDELSSLHSHYGNMFNAKGWATGDFYWSATSSGSNYYRVALGDGVVGSSPLSYHNYASCVSDS
ncbi:DUF1566 domain-containing protein [Vibrio splendidus]|uniref:Lcl domain-containing protein n=1 Tax=Vibrio splendidus TaxID=29497 RepID=UPI00240EACBE|nr:DUF1566 domain-containing protein [Vibrio splendidus]